MSAIKFDGKVGVPAKFDQGLRQGTVEWERAQRQGRGEIRRWKDIQEERRDATQWPLLWPLVSSLRKARGFVNEIR